MTAVIVVGALVIVVLAIGSMALDEPTRDDAAGRTSRRPPGTLGTQPSPLGEAVGDAIEAAAEAGSDLGDGAGAPRARRQGDDRDAPLERPHHAIGTMSARSGRAERDDDPPRGSGSSGDSGGWSWGGWGGLDD